MGTKQFWRSFTGRGGSSFNNQTDDFVLWIWFFVYSAFIYVESTPCVERCWAANIKPSNSWSGLIDLGRGVWYFAEWSFANNRFGVCCCCLSCVTKDYRTEAWEQVHRTISVPVCMCVVDWRWTQGSVLALRPKKRNAGRNTAGLNNDN